MEDVSRLGGPWGNGALARGDEEAAFAVEVMLGAEKGKRSFGGLVVEEPFRLNEIDLDGVDVGDAEQEASVLPSNSDVAAAEDSGPLSGGDSGAAEVWGRAS